MAFESFEFVVKGTVHGVGFRYYVRELARAEGIVGWVKNDPVCGLFSCASAPPHLLQQGDVIGMAQGDDAALDKLYVPTLYLYSSRPTRMLFQEEGSACWSTPRHSNRGGDQFGGYCIATPVHLL